MDGQTFIIVGAGHAGVNAAATLRMKGFNGRLILLEAGNELPYQRPPLSKEFLATAEPSSVRLRSSDFYVKKAIELIQGQQALEIDPAGRVVKTDQLTLKYDRLMLASGSSLRQLDALPLGTPAVHYLKTFKDAANLRQSIVPGGRVAIIGAGYIGLEVAAVAQKLGAEVTVIEAAPRAMSRVTSTPVSDFFVAAHRRYGVHFHFGSSVSSLENNAGSHCLILSDGNKVEADVLFVGVGVFPNQQLAVDAGLECSHGVHVDVQGRTCDKSIFAAGDVARVIGHPIRPEGLTLECLQNANDLSRIAAEAMLGGSAVYNTVPWFWTEQFGYKLQSAGLAAKEHDIDVAEMSEDGGIVLYRRDDRIEAIDCINRQKQFLELKREIERTFSPEGKVK